MKIFLTFLTLALLAAAPMNAAILYQASNVTWTGGGAPPAVTLSTPISKTDTFYIQYTVELTSSVPAYTGGDANNKNSSYPYVAQANATNGGAAFLFYLGGGYDSNYLFSTGFTTSTWHTNQFSASNGATKTPTGMVAQYSTQQYGAVKFQVNMAVDMKGGTYSYTVNKLNASGAVIQTATLSGLNLDKGNYWNNNSTFSTLTFASSTSQMTSKFDSIIVSTTPIPIPEPGTFVLAGMGATLLGLSRRRRKA
jgi:hypothetical protein